MKNCTTCQHSHNRHHELCGNCYYVTPESDNPQSVIEALQLQQHGMVCKCGEARTRCLILRNLPGPLLKGGEPESNRENVRNARAFRVDEDPSLWYAECWNCREIRKGRKPGRPRKHSDEDRKWLRVNYNAVYRANLTTKLLQSYGNDGQWPECVMCLQPATRALYIGEFGKGPLGNHALRCRRMAISDPYWHSQFAPYCDHHEVMNVGQRHAEKQRRVQAKIDEALWKSTLTLAENEALHRRIP
jgi:hypothetical protein